MKTLAWVNLAGVLALGVLCVAQWRGNRELNLEVGRLEGIRLDNAAKLDKRDRNISSLHDDIASLQAQVLALTGSLRETEGKLTLAEKMGAMLSIERDQLKEAVKRWAQAVEARDTRIVESHDKIRELAERLNDVVARHNEIAASYNDVAKLLNERTQAYNELVRERSEPQKE